MIITHYEILTPNLLSVQKIKESPRRPFFFFFSSEMARKGHLARKLSPALRGVGVGRVGGGPPGLEVRQLCIVFEAEDQAENMR